MRAGLIPDGDIDARSIRDVQPDDVRGYVQCHFFAGLGGWPYALRLAGWPDGRPIWTGSPPCQPFSIAGKGLGEADPRHLWPDFFRLLRACRPATVMGEQVAGAAGYGWFDRVAADLGGEGYACRAVDIPAAAVNAPHIRQRLYWVADTYSIPERKSQYSLSAVARERPWVDDSGVGSRLSGLGDPCDAEWREELQRRTDDYDRAPAGRIQGAGLPGTSDEGAWDDWVLVGPDPQGKWRRVKPGLPLLAPRLPGDVSKLRALGNALVAPLAVEVIKAYMEAYGYGMD